jgi:hypothetical protein
MCAKKLVILAIIKKNYSIKCIIFVTQERVGGASKTLIALGLSVSKSVPAKEKY